MKLYLATASLMVMTLCATLGAQTKPDQTPFETVVDKQSGDNDGVQPAPEKIRLTPDVVRAAQQSLNDEAYESGTPDGKTGPGNPWGDSQVPTRQGAQSDRRAG
jgi:hypothetical protein